MCAFSERRLSKTRCFGNAVGTFPPELLPTNTIAQLTNFQLLEQYDTGAIRCTVVGDLCRIVAVDGSALVGPAVRAVEAAVVCRSVLLRFRHDGCYEDMGGG